MDDYKMQGYTLAALLRKTRRRYQLSASSQALFYELVAIANEERWPHTFKCSNGELCSALNVSEKTLSVLRNELIQCGLLSYKSGKSKRTVSDYGFVLVVNNTTNTTTKATTVPTTNANTKATTNRSDYYKEKEENKKKSSKESEEIAAVSPLIFNDVFDFFKKTSHWDIEKCTLVTKKFIIEYEHKPLKGGWQSKAKKWILTEFEQKSTAKKEKKEGHPDYWSQAHHDKLDGPGFSSYMRHLRSLGLVVKKDRFGKIIDFVKEN